MVFPFILLREGECSSPYDGIRNACAANYIAQLGVALLSGPGEMSGRKVASTSASKCRSNEDTARLTVEVMFV